MGASLRVSLVLIGVFIMTTCHSASIPNNFDPRMTDDIIMPKKRPFCNAFTGCGRKRSMNPPGMPLQAMMRSRQFDEDNYDADSTMEDLSRQILSEAKLWEAIQEASAQIVRRNQKEALL